MMDTKIPTIGILLFVVVLLLTLTGCVEGNVKQVDTKTGKETKSTISSTIFTQDLPDGRTVICVYADDNYAEGDGGPSCDFEHATVDIGEDK